MISLKSLIAGLALTGLLTTEAAEAGLWELGAYGGVTFPGIADVRLQQPNQTDVTWHNASSHLSAAYGFNVTYWTPWRGLELGLQGEVERFDANLKNQNQFRTGQVKGVPQAQNEDLNPHDVDITLVGLNLLVRTSLGPIQPYVGVGGGVAFADMRIYDYFFEQTRPSDQSDLSISPMWQVIGGVTIPVAGSWYLFTQYKYSESWHSFDWSNATTSWTITAHHVVGGIGYRF